MFHPDRHVAVYARLATDENWFAGSGCFVGGSLYVTSRHVVRTDSGSLRDTVRIHLRSIARLVDCEVVWCGDDEVDAALLRVVSAGAPLPTLRKPLRWGYFATSMPRQNWQAIGYPAFEGQGPDQSRVVSQVTGSINPLTGVAGGRLSVDVDSAPATLLGDKSLWAGMSGAAVMCEGNDEIVVGIVRKDAAHFESRRLSVVPVERCMADRVFRELVAEASGREPVLEPVELARLFAQQASPDSPAALLFARAAMVGFRGRDAELAQLREWCARDEAFSVHVVAGPGGQGKTRLAAELVTEMAAGGWVAGFVHDKSPEELAVLGSLRKPALLVVDYAETKTETIAALSTATRQTESVVRLLLLARSAGEWRLDAIDPVLDYLMHTPVLQLGALERTPEGRLSAWREAVFSLAGALSRLADYEGASAYSAAVAEKPPSWIRVEQDDEVAVLGIHMAALAALLSAAEPGVSDGSAMDTLLRHEKRYWTRTATAQEFAVGNYTLADTIAMGTLFTADTEREALTLVAAMPGLRDLPENRHIAAVRWLASTLPSTESYWASLQPDRLGERHVAHILDGRPDLFTSLVGVASSIQVERALTVLCRAAVDAPHLDEAIRSVVDVAPHTTGPAALSVAIRSENPAPLLSSLRRMVEGADVDLLATLSAAVPVRTEILRDIGIDVSKRLVAAYRNAPEEQGLPLARALARLAVRLRNGGWLESALQVNQEAIELFNRFSDLSDNSYLLDLASALGSLADQLSRLDRLPESVEVSERSVAIVRRVADADPASRVRLAGALNGFASRLGLAGEKKRAAAVAAEAVEINRSLATDTGDEAYRAGLAASLNILGVSLGLVGRAQAALAAIEEALEIRRNLAKAEPDAYGAQLAASLNNLSGHLWNKSGPQAGLEAIEEAVAILRVLGEANPDAHQQDFARALNNLADRFVALGRHRDAVETRRELVRVRRRLVEARPKQHQAELAAALMLTATSLGAIDETAEAVDFVTDAIVQYQGLAGDYRLPLARALQARAEWLITLGRAADALTSMNECVAVHRLLAAEDGGKKLSGALLQLSVFLAREDRPGEARSVVEEAVDIRRSLAARGGKTQRSDLASTLVRLSTLLGEQGARNEALKAISEAADIRRELSPDQGLAGTLEAYADQLVRVGRLWDAKNALLEAVKVLKLPRHRRRLVELHRRLARLQIQLRLPQDAAKSAAAAVATQRQLARLSDHEFSKLAATLRFLAEIHEAGGEHAKAAAASAEADQLRSRLVPD